MREVISLTPDILFCHVEPRPAAAADYRQKKLLAAMRAKDPHHRRQPAAVDLGALTLPAEAVPIAPAAAHPTLSASHRELLERFIRCAVAALDQRYPLLAGETLESDFASFLSAEYQGFPAGTAVIRRTTDMAVLCYLITNVVVGPNGQLWRRDASTTGDRRLRAGAQGLTLQAPMTVGSVATWIGGQLASGLVSAIGGAIFNGLMEQLFPPGVPSYFDAVYAQMAKIVKQELAADKIESINGALNAVKEHLGTEYARFREQADLGDESDRRSLFDLLQKYDAAFLSGPAGMMQTLQSDSHRMGGFAVFMLGASVQLALFQEMANVVPQRDRKSGGWLRPIETSYGKPRTGTVATTAKAFAAHVDTTWPLLLDARVKVIGTRIYEAHKHVVPGTGDAYCQVWGEISDNGKAVQPRRLNDSDEKNGSNPSKARLRADGEAYKLAMKAELMTSYNQPKDVADLWRRLIEQPIPMD